MKLAWFLLVGMMAASSAVAAASVDVAVGWDDMQGGGTYLRYFPETVVVHAGDTVQWKAISNTPHTVTQANPTSGTPEGFFMFPGGFDSSPSATFTPADAQTMFGPGGFLTPGHSFSRTFNQTGSYIYICKIHPGMTGRITVVNETTSSGSSGSPLPLPGGSPPGNESSRDVVDIHAGWGSGDTSVDKFAPDAVTVPVGTTIVWTNTHSDEPHTVTGWTAGQAPAPGSPPNSPPAFDSSPNIQGEPPGFVGPQGVLMAGGDNKAFSKTFDTAGTYVYRCKLHAGMWGTVIVLDKASAMAPGSGTGAQGSGTSGATNTAAGSRIPGFDAVFVLAGLGLAAFAFRRR